MTREREVSALVNKRMLLLAEIQIAERRLASLRANLVAVDTQVASFALGPERGPRRRRGFVRAIIDTLREADTPLTAEEIAERIARPRRRVLAALKRRKGNVIVQEGERWRID